MYSTGSWPSGSHGAENVGIYRGRIESIDDPKKRNRVSTRIFGYQDDQGNIPKEQLEWIHTMGSDSQLPGAGSTHNFFPGSEVLVLNNGTEKFIIGSVPGFDGEKRLSQNPWGVDSSENQNADVPNINRQNNKDSSIRPDQNSSLVGPPGDKKGLSDYFNYNNWQQLIRNFFPYSTGKGEPPAPWGQGDVTKFDQLMSIALQKNQFGSDILSVIKNLDNNQSGSIQSALDIILNLRNNGFTDAASVIGQQPLNAAINQYASTFGSYNQSYLLTLLQTILNIIQLVQTFNQQNFVQNVLSDDFHIIITFLSNVTFNISQDHVIGIQNIHDMIAMNPMMPQSMVNDFLSQFLNIFNSAITQAFNSVISQINSIINSVGDNGTFVSIFGGSNQFVQFSQVINSIAAYLNIPGIAINTIANGLVGVALGGGQLPLNMNSNQGGNGGNPLTGLLAMFIGNKIGTIETLTKQLIKDFLSKNPQKYQDVPRNNGPQVLKKFPD